MPENLLDYYDSLIEKYKRKGIIIDSNLLIYYFVGEYNLNLLSTYKRTQLFKIDGYNLVKYIIEKFDRIITSPHILTEVSNLANQIENKYKFEFYDMFCKKLEILDEKYFFTKEVLKDSKIRRLGITDSFIYKLAQEHLLVITDDLTLCNYLEQANLDYININNIMSIDYNRIL